MGQVTGVGLNAARAQHDSTHAACCDRGAPFFFSNTINTPQFGSLKTSPDEKLIPRKIQNCYDPG